MKPGPHKRVVLTIEEFDEHGQPMELRGSGVMLQLDVTLSYAGDEVVAQAENDGRRWEGRAKDYHQAAILDLLADRLGLHEEMETEPGR